MRMLFGRRRTQRGAALIALTALVVLGMAWVLVSATGSPAAQKAAQAGHNARVMAEAKAALIAYVAANALESGEDNPGRLPCPQAWGDVGSTNEGRAAPNCATPAAGWLPWRTLGLPKMLDASGRQFWYVISPGWHLPSAGATLTINSNTAGQLNVDGRAAVALIIAPGGPLSVAPSSAQQAAGCVARNQSQALDFPATAPNVLDFLECQNGSTADNIFASSVVDNATNPVFNDQVLAITTADILPALEATIAKRIERDIVPALQDVPYSGTKWNPAAANKVYQFAAPFANPGTSNFQGAAGISQGLMPFSYLPACSPAGDPRCTSSTYHAWSSTTLSKTSGSGNLWSGFGPNCSVSGTTVTCTGYYQSGALVASFDDRADNIANALRDFNVASHTVRVWTILYNGSSWDSWLEVTGTVALSRQLNSNASLSFLVSNIPLRWAWGTDYGYYYIEAQRPTFTNHALLSATDSVSPCPSSPPYCTGWFVRNEWYRLAYYAIAPNLAAGGTLSCTTGTTCLTVANVSPADNKRAVLVLAGRSLTGAARPNATFADFLEGANANTPVDTAFEQRTISRATFNDRVVVIDANP